MKNNTAINMEMGNMSRMARALSMMGPDYDYGKLTNGLDSRGHGTDAGKLPWHPTFSQESDYSSLGMIGGRWGEPTSILPASNSYTPSMDMINSGMTKGLAEYMKRAEPNGVLETTPPMNRKAFLKAME